MGGIFNGGYSELIGDTETMQKIPSEYEGILGGVNGVNPTWDDEN